MTAPDFPLPRLHPLLKVYRAHDAAEGKPIWTLHDPLSNQYYRIGWAEFECLSRFSRAATGQELRALVENETTLRIDIMDVATLVSFLKSKGLLCLDDQKVAFKEKPSVSWLKKILHGYLFFTIPLARPEAFLRRTLPYVRPLMTRGFIMTMLGLFIAAALMTVQRADEFFNTFTGMISWEGALTIAVTFFIVKLVHEMAHAYTAVRYGVPVPHMGVAFMVMYPMLYTEVTGSWRLPSRIQRLHIGMAGVTAELCLAAIALLAWNFLPYGGMGQAVAFSVVAISLVGSLLINLNPLMRFDGYYILSDYTGFDNLQARACAFARWTLRRILFDWPDDAPESLNVAQIRFLTCFGFALLTYRFFLFLGIAVLVYHVFFKPLGAILMAVEIIYFILLPILSELKIWWSRRSDVVSTRRGKIVTVAAVIILAFMFVPVSQTAALPAVIHSASVRSLYPPAPSYVAVLNVKEGQAVRAGDPLIHLESPELDNDLKLARKKLENYETIKRRGQTQTETAAQIISVDADIARLRAEIKDIEGRRRNLVVTAPFDGIIRDFNPLLQTGRFVSVRDLLFRIVDPSSMSVTGYGGETDIQHLKTGAPARFYSEGDARHVYTLRLGALDAANSANLPWPELASVYGGPIPAHADERGHVPVPLTTLYMAHFVVMDPAEDLPGHVETGRVRVDLPPSSIFSSNINKLISMFRREIGLN